MLIRLRKPIRLIVILIVLTALAYSIRYIPRFMYDRYGYLGYSQIKDEEAQARLRMLIPRLKGLQARVVWSSDRSGNPELFLLDTAAAAIYQLTQNGFSDTFPRFSPDGSKVVFARSARPYVPEEKLDDWHIFVLDLVSGDEEMVAQKGAHPQWVSGQSISFLRQGHVIVLDMETGEEKTIWDAEQDAGGQAIAYPELDPSYSPDRDPNLPRRMAFTSLGGKPNAIVYDPNQNAMEPVGPGRQLTWLAGRGGVIWVEDQGPGRYVIRGKEGPLLNPAGAHVAQECPRSSRDGRYLLWTGAMPNQEIFLWPLGAPADEVVRLSFDPGNDRWPDIYMLPQ
jgi:dipeptidyl aminopeptidase/acylaminoacyl peptidase